MEEPHRIHKPVPFGWWKALREWEAAARTQVLRRGPHIKLPPRPALR